MWIYSILSIIVPVIIIGIIIAGITAIVRAVAPQPRAVSENEKQTSVRRGKAVLKTIYLYLVLFITLMMSIGGAIGVFVSAANYIAPDYYVESYDQYKQSHCDQNQIMPYGHTPGNDTDAQIQPYPKDGCDDAELQKRYDAMKQELEAEAKNSALKTLIQSFGWILIPLPIFLYFQRQMNRAEQQDHDKTM